MGNSGKRVVATNRQAKREFEIFDTIEAGMVLQGSELNLCAIIKLNWLRLFVEYMMERFG